MKILALESSAKAGSVAILDNQKILGEFYLNVGLTHSQTLAPMIKTLLENTKLSLEDIDAFAVSVGPGSFTGIRIGVSTIKGMAFALNKPCIGVSTLEGMAFNIPKYNGIICTCMDARCNQVYNALFEIQDNLPKRLTKDRAISIEDLINELKLLQKKVILVGDGAEICYNKMKDIIDTEIAPEHLRYQRASTVALAAGSIKEKSNLISCNALNPVYLRLSQAERELQKKKKEVTLS